MNQSVSQKPSGFRNESGATIIIVTFFMVALFAFAALSLDVGNVLREQRKAQIATDAAALAGAILLTNGNDTVVITGATAIAEINGVTTNEIGAGATTGRWGNYPGQIQVGNWDTNRPTTTRFQDGGTPRNAVRVPARRNVPLHFAPIVGLRNMNPVVVSVATLESLATPTGLRPWGVSSNLLAGVGIGDSVTVDLKADPNGIWGYAYFNQNVEQWNTPDWKKYMSEGYPGTVDLANSYAAYAKRGNPALAKELGELADSGAVVFIPVAAGWDNTDLGKYVPLVGFVAVRITQGPKQGNKQNVVFTVVEALGTGGGGGPSGSIWLKGRSLVQ